MSVEVVTKPATITDDMSFHLQMSIDISNAHIEQMAEDYKKSNYIKKVDPNDGRKVIITLKVNPKTGSIEQSEDFVNQ